ncbi:MAG: translocation/assembly module TamB domain-containing protein [Candidatus Delongbacteria bacterium]|nr:translocation/assembly module TamB domain-containing protein [Candidatus Delongbacteria bacterium]MBN2835430.1 translocation/assembly module TamB domain-containing protein [Candidatus Delongbacteria bacterium]
MKRFRKILLIILIALFFLPIIILNLVKLRYVQDIIISKVNDNLNGFVYYGDLSINYFGTDIKIKKLGLNDISKNKIASIDEIYVKLSFYDLIRTNLVIDSVLVKNPILYTDIDSSGALNFVNLVKKSEKKDEIKTITEEPKEDVDKKNIILKALSIENLNLDYVKTGMHAKLSGFNLIASAQTAPLTAKSKINLDSIIYSDKKIEEIITKLDIETELINEKVDLSIDLAGDAITLKIEGLINSIFENQNFDIKIASNANLKKFQPLVGKVFDGDFSTDISIWGTKDNPNLEMLTSISNFNFDKYKADEINLDILAQNGVAYIRNLSVSVDSTKIFLNGKSDISSLIKGENWQEKLSYNINLLMNDLIPNDYFSHELTNNGKVDIDLKINGKGIAPNYIDTNLELSTKFVNYESGLGELFLNTNLDIYGGVANVKILHTDLLDISFDADGKYNLLTKDAEISTILNSTNLTKAINLFKLDLKTDYINLENKILIKNDEISGDLKLNSGSIEFSDFSIGDLKVDVTIDRGEVKLDTLFIGKKSSSIFVSARTKILDKFKILKNPYVELELYTDLDGDYINDNLKGKFITNGSFKGKVKELTGKLDLDFNNPGWNIDSLKQITGSITILKNKVIIDKFNLDLNDKGTISIKGDYDKKDKFNVKLITLNPIRIGNLDRVKPLGINSFTSIEIDAGGSINNPDVKGMIKIDSLEYKNLDLGDSKLDFTMSDKKIDGKLKSLVNSDFFYDLDTGFFTTILNADSLILDNFLHFANLPESKGKMKIFADFNGNINRIEKIKGELDINSIKLSDAGVQLVENGKITANVNGFDETAFLVNFDLAGTDSIVVNGSYLSGNLFADISTEVNLKRFDKFVEPLEISQGFVNVNIKGAYIDGKPDFKLNGKLANINLVAVETNTKVSDFNGDFSLDETGFNLDNIKGFIDSGSFSINGKGSFDENFKPTGEISISLNSLPLSVPELLSITLNGNIKSKLNKNKYNIDGNVEIVEGLFYKDIAFDFMSLMDKKPARKFSFNDTKSTVLDSISLNINILSKNPFTIDNNLAYMEIKPDLAIKGTASSPIILGRTQVVNGEISFQKRSFTIEKGVIDFTNPYKIEPDIDLLAKSEIDIYQIGMEINGKPDAMLFRLYSEPFLENPDILSLLITGKTITKKSGNDDPVSAQSMLINMINSTLSDDVKKSTGLDVFSVNSSGTGDEEKLSVNIGKNITDRLMLLYTLESGKDKNNYITTASYRLLETLYLEGYRATEGNFGSGIKFRWEFR